MFLKARTVIATYLDIDYIKLLICDEKKASRFEIFYRWYFISNNLDDYKEDTY